MHVWYAKYEDDKKELFYSIRIFNEFDHLSKAGLNVHEAVYKVMRDEYGHTDSDATREIVGRLFTDDPKAKLELISYLPKGGFSIFGKRSSYEKLDDLYHRNHRAQNSDSLDSLLGDGVNFNSLNCSRVKVNESAELNHREKVVLVKRGKRSEIITSH